ncbi:hypothetical protein V8E51_003062 [Hyaloscypha variabilis]
MDSNKLSNFPVDSERCPVIDSWRSWKEIGEAQLQSSHRNIATNTTEITTPLEKYEAFDSHSKLVQYNFPSYNHEDWIVVDRPMLYHADGVCVDNESCNIHDRGIFHEINWITVEKESRDFHLFSSLPVEVRRQIWKFTLPSPRILKLSLGRRDYGKPRTSQQFVTRIDYSIDQLVTNPLSAQEFRQLSGNLKITCQESHQVFLENYYSVPLRGTSIASLWDEEVDAELSDIGNIPEVKYKSPYFDRNRDTLVLPYEDLEQLNACNAWLDLSALKYVAVSCFCNGSIFRQGTKALLDQWPHLRRLDIILGHMVDSPDQCNSPTDTCRLIEIHDHKSLDLMQDSSYSCNLRYLKQRKAEVIAQWNWLKNTGFVDFRIHLLGTIRGDGYTFRDPEPIYLVSTKPSLFGVSHYTIPPPEQYDKFMYHNRRNRMMIFGLQFQAACLHDGTLLHVLDGDVMRILFGESD